MNNENNVESVLYAVGTRGYSAYEVAVQNGFVGTEQEWLDSLVGPTGEMGPEGKSAYEIAVENGYPGTEEDWVNDFISSDGYYNKQEIDEKIVDNLTTTSTNKALSANQGKVLDDKISDLDDEVALKLNSSVADETFTTKTQFNSEISTINAQISAIGSGSPLTAGSVDDMTNESRIYVNTSDGNWYYYDGDSWEIGGVYQSSGIGFEEVEFNNLDDTLTTSLFGHTKEIDKYVSWYLSNYNANASRISSPMLYKKGTTITFGNDFLTNYKYKIFTMDRITGALTAIEDWGSSSTYTFTDDTYGALAFRPYDANWDTTSYTVDNMYIPTKTDIDVDFYYPLNKKYELVDLDGGAVRNMWCKGNCVHSSSFLNFMGANNRIGICQVIKSKFRIKIFVENGYQYGVQTFSNAPASLDTFVDDTGWLSDPIIIPANTYFTMSIRKSDNSNVTFNEELIDKIKLTSYGDFDYIDSEISDQINRVGDYYYTGDDLDLTLKKYYDAKKLFTGINPGTAGNTLQGFDIYDNKIFQLTHGDVGIQVRNLSDGEVLGLIPLTGIGHGETGQFSKVKYDEGDYAPLLYTVSDSTPGYVSVVRIVDLNTAAIIKRYILQEEDGYYSGQCFDFENGYIISIGYKVKAFRSSANDNKMIVSIYNMNEATLIEGIDYEPTLLERYEMPFIYTAQGQKFLNGKCYIISSYLTSEQPTRIYVFDAYRRMVTNVITNLPTEINTTEAEDLAFVENEETNRYDMIVFTRRWYTRFQFK